MSDFLQFDNTNQNFIAALGWDENTEEEQRVLSSDHDLDFNCYLVDENFGFIDCLTPTNPKVDKYRFQILHTGDHQTGSSPGEDEEFHINLQKLETDVHYLVFSVNTKNNLPLSDVKSHCVFMDGASYTKFLDLDMQPANDAAQDGNAEFVAACLKRHGGGLDGDNWSLVSLASFVEGESNPKDTYKKTIKEMMEKI